MNVIYHKEYIIKKLFSEGVITVFQYTDYSPQGNPTTLQWVENYSTYVIFCSNSAKKWSQINFFFSEFPQVQTFFALFLQKKNLTRFFSKIHYYRLHQFWKCSLKKTSFFFNTVFRRLRKSFGWYYTGFLAQKIGRYMEWYPFFFVISFFFLSKKVSEAEIGQKKKGYHF